MYLPSGTLGCALAAALTLGTAAQAGDYRPPELPEALSARHVEKPFPDGGGLAYKRNGPNPWTIAALGCLAGAGVSAGLAKGQDKRMREAPDRQALDKAFGTQKTLAWTSVGLLGGAAVGFTFSKVL